MRIRTVQGDAVFGKGARDSWPLQEKVFVSREEEEGGSMQHTKNRFNYIDQLKKDQGLWRVGRKLQRGAHPGRKSIDNVRGHQDELLNDLLGAEREIQSEGSWEKKKLPGVGT